MTPTAEQYIIANHDRSPVSTIAKTLHIGELRVREFMKQRNLTPFKSRKPRPTNEDPLPEHMRDFKWAYPELHKYGITGMVRFPDKNKVWDK